MEDASETLHRIDFTVIYTGLQHTSLFCIIMVYCVYIDFLLLILVFNDFIDKILHFKYMHDVVTTKSW